MKKIGMIGIGLMGHGIASNIVKHGYPLTVMEHEGNQPLESLLAQGVKTVKTPRALGAETEIILLCVTGAPQVESVLTGADGLITGLKPGSIVIDCSTSIPSSTQKLAKLVTAAGSVLIDAAMTRTPKEAAEGRLNLLVGSDARTFEAVKPVLDCFAENIHHMGEVGAGHQMKLLHNYVSLGTVTVIAEAAACARKSGIAPEEFVDVLHKGGGWGAALERLKPYLLNDGDTSNLRFSLSNASKDLGYYTTYAADTHADHTVAAAIKQTITQECDAGHGDEHMPNMIAYIAARSGRDGTPH